MLKDIQIYKFIFQFKIDEFMNIKQIKNNNSDVCTNKQIAKVKKI